VFTAFQSSENFDHLASFKTLGGDIICIEAFLDVAM
jgi:hypothetical protein